MRRLLLLLALIGAARASAQETISNGLTLKVPSVGSQNWGALFRDEFATPISAHDHTGGGKGNKIGTGAISAFAIDDTLFRPRNNQWIVGRNAANSANINLLKLNSSNLFELGLTLLPTTTGIDLGSVTAPYDDIYADQLWAATSVETIGINSPTGALDLGVSGTPHWVMDTEGDLLPYATEDLGSSISRVGTVYSEALDLSTPLPIGQGGTSGSTAAAAASALGVGTEDSPTFTGTTLSGLSASLPVFTDGSKALSSKTAAQALTALDALVKPGYAGPTGVVSYSGGTAWEAISGLGVTISVAANETVVLVSTIPYSFTIASSYAPGSFVVRHRRDSVAVTTDTRATGGYFTVTYPGTGNGYYHGSLILIDYDTPGAGSYTYTTEWAGLGTAPVQHSLNPRLMRFIVKSQ